MLNHDHRVMEEEDDGEIYLNESFFIDESYVAQSFQYGPHAIDVFALRSSATDYDLTGQLIWPGAELMNHFLAKNSQIVEGAEVIELGSGVGLTGLLCSRLSSKVVMTDHKDIVLKVLERNIKMSLDKKCNASVVSERLEWGNMDHLSYILGQHPKGFDIVIGADICYQQESIPLLFKTVCYLLAQRSNSKFLLAYVSRAKSNDAALLREANNHNLEVLELHGTRTPISGGAYEGLIFQINLRSGVCPDKLKLRD